MTGSIVDLDGFGRKILGILRQNGRLTHTDLTAKVELVHFAFAQVNFRTRAEPRWMNSDRDSALN